MQKHYLTVEKLPKGTLFRSKTPGVTITGYNSGKVLFQGKYAQQEASRWGTPHTTPANFQDDQGLPNNFAELSVLGSDEVGTGSYFGPLTTAAVFVKHEYVDTLIKAGVKDSKKLSDPVINRLGAKIMQLCPYHVVNVVPDNYNRLVKKYNQAQLKAICHNFVLNKVLQKIKPTQPDAILIDQFVRPQTYFNYLKEQTVIVKKGVYFKEKGESYHVAVAAASIVARYVSLRTMDQLSQEAGITLPIGSGNNVDQVAAELLREQQSLAHFAKLHFKNTRKAHHIAQNKLE